MACAISLGHAVDTQTASAGIVHSVFDHAVNLALGADLWTLLDAGRHDMPFGIRIGSAAFGTLRLKIGDHVSVRCGFVGIASGASCHAVDCRTAPRWQPRRAGRLAPGLDRRLAVVAAAASGRAWHGASAMADALRSVLGTADAKVQHRPLWLDGRKTAPCLGPVRAMSLADIVGSGLGATPSGDDVLIGALAVLTAPEAGEAGAAAARNLVGLIQPLLPRTTDLSAHLLRQAARGLIGRALQDLIGALVADSEPERLQFTVQAVVETGATSGADTCMGVLAAATSFLLPRAERAQA